MLAVLPELIFPQARQSPQQILDVFARALTQHGLKSARQNRCVFDSCQLKQMIYYIELLQQFGTRLSDKVTKYISDDIWELRPGGNRIFYFFHCDNTFVLLHAFRKKTQKTPKREIEKAKAERADYLSRKDDLP